MWKDLIYDKSIGNTEIKRDNSYNNFITSKISLEDLDNGDFTVLYGKPALEIINKMNSYVPQSLLGYDHLYKIKLYIQRKALSDSDIRIIVISVNVIKLEEIFKESNEIPDYSFLKTLFRYHLAYDEVCVQQFSFNFSNEKKITINNNMTFIMDKAMQPNDYSLYERKYFNNNNLININLFDYQKCNIDWMIDKEKNKKVICYNLNNEIILGNLYFDLYQFKLDLVENRKQIKFHGACLIDEVGLGKTIQMIALCLENPSNDFSYTKPNIKKLCSKATLIFCPNQLCGQWLREFKDKILCEKKDDSNIKIISLLTKRDHDKYTYSDLLDSDFVIVSFNFLDNPCFTSLWLPTISNIKSFCRKEISPLDLKKIDSHFSELSNKLFNDPINTLYKNRPLIQCIHWHRIIVDEIHEIFNENGIHKPVANLLPFFSADFKWCLTATPFTFKNNLCSIVDYVTNYKNSDRENIFLEEKIVDYLSSSFFRRNTKASIKAEYIPPDINEEIRWLKFSQTERMMYNAYLADDNNNKYDVFLRKLCCHPQLAEETRESLSNCKTLNDMEKIMVSHYKTKVIEAETSHNKILNRMDKINEKIKEIQDRIDSRAKNKKADSKSDTISKLDFDDFDDLDPDIFNSFENNTFGTITINKLKEYLKELDKKKDESFKILQGKISTYNFFNNVIDRIRKTSTKNNDSQLKTELALESIKKLNIDNDKDSDSDDECESDLDSDNESDSDSESNNDDEICGICLGEIPEQNIGVTICGHLFCYDCLKLSVNKYHKCPYCKQNLNDKNLFSISYEKKLNKNASKENLNKEKLVNIFGTKLANLILYLRDSKEHTIIFSQWDDLLRKIGKILSDNNIPNIFCRGNCYQRDKAIREFNNDDKIKVIMLSSESAAAGTNLTKASQIIFIDPIYGSYEFRKGQEKQAIGRAHRLGQKSTIRVIRFIIKDTIEEEIYNINIDQEKQFALDYANKNDIIVE